MTTLTKRPDWNECVEYMHVCYEILKRMGVEFYSYEGEEVTIRKTVADIIGSRASAMIQRDIPDYVQHSFTVKSKKVTGLKHPKPECTVITPSLAFYLSLGAANPHIIEELCKNFWAKVSDNRDTLALPPSSTEDTALDTGDYLEGEYFQVVYIKPQTIEISNTIVELKQGSSFIEKGGQFKFVVE